MPYGSVVRVSVDTFKILMIGPSTDRSGCKALSPLLSAAADPYRIGATEDLMASMGVLLDLNVIADCQNPDGEEVGGDSVCANSEQHQEVPCHPVIDVDDFDDDVLPSSRSTFQEARKRSQTRKRSTASDDDVVIFIGRPLNFQVNKRKKSSVCQQQSYDTSPRIQMNNVPELSHLPQQVPARVDPTFSCPICMEKLNKETSTKCGHIFCEVCIKKALAKRKWCPVCRKKLRANNIIRIYLPDVTRV